MQNKEHNKMMNSDDVKKKEASLVEESYLFPEHGVTIMATSLEEATEKLKKLSNKD